MRSVRITLFSQGECEWVQLYWKPGTSIRLKLYSSTCKLRELPQCTLSYADKNYDWLAPQILQVPYWKNEKGRHHIWEDFAQRACHLASEAERGREEEICKRLSSFLKSSALVRVDILISKKTTALLPRVSWWPPGRVWWLFWLKYFLLHISTLAEWVLQV